MSAYCRGCGTQHDEDDDRLCSRCAMQNRVVLASVERRAAYMGVEALRDEVARLKALLVNCRTRMALADEYLHRQKAVHTRGTSGALYDLRERAETTLSEMERYGWCAHDCLDEDSNLVVGSEAWKVAEAKVLARIDAALKSPSGDIPQCTRAATPAPTDADRRETGRISSTTPPPGAPQVGTGGDVARECQGTSDPTTADRRGEDGECINKEQI